ncbi:MAG: hypothetical protein J7L34_06820 [Thermotogaceae bacterium]|nr:hypothetical protein [Thermotogaceae bacterium]
MNLLRVDDKDLAVLNKEVFDDLGVDVLVKSASENDSFVREVFKEVLLSPASSVQEIRYRQEILKDALKNEEVVRSLYEILTNILEGKRKRYLAVFGRYPSSLVYGSYRLLNYFMESFDKVIEIKEKYSEKFESAGFRELFSWIDEVSKRRDRIESFLETISFNKGYSFKIGVGAGGLFSEVTPVIDERTGKLSRFFRKRVIHIVPGDEVSERVVFEIKERGLYDLSRVLSKITKTFLKTLENLRFSLAFLAGALNVHKKLNGLGYAVSFPKESSCFYFEELFDPSLALLKPSKVVGNSLSIRKSLIVITGANKGGKTIFLRSIGLAQLMFQSGLFVPAKEYKAPVFNGIFSHFRKEEDERLQRGKLEEELKRMKNIVDLLRPRSLLLLNESFSSTNEVEGTEIAKQITYALRDSGNFVFFVTHFARFKGMACSEGAECLSAEVLKDGRRTFRIIKDFSANSCYGRDLFRRIFEEIEVK